MVSSFAVRKLAGKLFEAVANMILRVKYNRII